MYKPPSVLICPNCGNSLDSEASIDASYVSCNNCKSRFPLIKGRIPFLFPQPEKVLGQFSNYYQHYIDKERKRIAEFESQGREITDRRPFYDLLVKGLNHNLKVIEEVQSSLHSFLPKESIDFESIEKMAYTTDLSYLLRDWSGEEVHEQEVSKIVDSIGDMLSPYYQSHDRMLVLGAGMGRIAVEVGKNFKEVLALDNSPTMAICFERLLDSSIDFYDVQLKRAFTISEMVQEKNASLLNRDKDLLISAQKTNYILGNALNMPIQDKSIEVVLSAYFTDVFPLDLLLDEVNRVLKPGGLFLHFGPLEYHFPDESSMYAAEEFKAIFEQKGFEWVNESTLENTNFSRPGSMLQQSYMNWQFLARKINKGPVEALQNSSYLSISCAVSYKIEGQISEQNEPVVTLFPEGLGSLATTPVVLEILKLMGDPIKLEDLLIQFCVLFEVSVEEIRGMVLQSLEQLLEKGVVKIQGSSL
ncbi:methyltransferase domain-containing protein [uncultured Cyclobacterium sp.]|uniref:methyltransferase domain-containing protein n=1 Tax=uncultured Cyclobacterium sp. TaxID=453820 RepID=UPI0030EF0F42|tara:strand:- start:14388 stop:15806 length:1419 start_codon:yes stop_codon:yes gene_type:complete